MQAARRIPTGGFTTREWALQAVAFGLAPLLAVPFLLGVPLPVSVAGAVAYFGVMEAFCLGRVYIDSIELLEDGVVFHYPLRTDRARWAELTPAPQPIVMGLFWVTRPDVFPVSVTGWKAYGVTFEQARAIISSPNCPKWTLPPEVSRRLESSFRVT